MTRGGFPADHISSAECVKENGEEQVMEATENPAMSRETGSHVIQSPTRSTRTAQPLERHSKARFYGINLCVLFNVQYT